MKPLEQHAAPRWIVIAAIIVGWSIGDYSADWLGVDGALGWAVIAVTGIAVFITLGASYGAWYSAVRRGRRIGGDGGVAVERDDGVLVLLPVGRLDSTNARALEAIMVDRINAGEHRMVVDFSRLNFISSSGMRVLLLAAKHLHSKQGALVLCAMQDHIHEIFRISGYDQLIPIWDSRPAACRAASAGKPEPLEGDRSE